MYSMFVYSMFVFVFVCMDICINIRICSFLYEKIIDTNNMK